MWILSLETIQKQISGRIESDTRRDAKNEREAMMWLSLLAPRLYYPDKCKRPSDVMRDGG